MTDKNARVNNFEEETWKQWRFLLPLTHIVIALVLIVSLFVQEPKEWHRSFFTSSLMQDISASLGTFYVIKDISIDAENFTDSTCATYGTEDLQAMIEWGGKENLQSHLRDICEFQKVENELCTRVTHEGCTFWRLLHPSSSWCHYRSLWLPPCWARAPCSNSFSVRKNLKCQDTKFSCQLIKLPPSLSS